jgi:hypothetical protein
MPRLLTHKRMRKPRSMIQVYVRGVVKKFPIKEDGVQLNAEMNTQNTQNKRRKIVQNAKLQGFELWQHKVFAKNAKQGWRFFQPDNVPKPTPRSSYEAWGGSYESVDKIEQTEKIANRIMISLFFIFMVVLSII